MPFIFKNFGRTKPAENTPVEQTVSLVVEEPEQIEVEEEPQENKTRITVKVSHYNPTLGGTNCAVWSNGTCVSKMSNGEPWQNYWGDNNTIACPPELSFGTVIELDGNEYTCRDRGGAIRVTPQGHYWIDILAPNVPYGYGEIREAYIVGR